LKDRYVVVTPARNEQETLGLTIASMVGQRIRPAQWVIVDDGSGDRTREIAREAAREHDWIVLHERADRGFRQLGSGVVHAFDEGLARLDVRDWDFVVKLDADLSFGPEYFETLLRRFDANPRLGMASGKTFLPTPGGGRKLEWCHDEHVRGPSKMYSRACFEAIGGLEAVRGWDMIDETRAQMQGFETWSFPDLVLIHHRPIDARQPRVYRSRFDMGRLYHHLGYHWLYLAVRSARSALQDYPRGLGGLLLFLGWHWAWLRREPRYDPDFTAFVRRRQLERMSLRQLRAYIGSLTD
jgi:glycosyltransferase involved in cell wall biosynthesis